VTLSEALAILELTITTDERMLRLRFHELMRRHHPDVVDTHGLDVEASRDPSLITLAYSTVLEALRSTDGTLESCFSEESETNERIVNDARNAPRITHDSDSIVFEAPPDETFQLLYESAACIGGIGHVDRGLGLLEVIVRFEGGPSCSVLMTLQGRAHGTEVFCEMESIEAAPTPPISPVLEALVAGIRQSGQPSAN